MKEYIKVIKDLIHSYNNHIKNYEKSDCKTSNYYNLLENRDALENLLKEIDNMSRELHKKKDEELYAIYSTIEENYITDWKSKDEIKQIWLEDLINEAKSKVDNYINNIDKLI